MMGDFEMNVAVPVDVEVFSQNKWQRINFQDLKCNYVFRVIDDNDPQPIEEVPIFVATSDAYISEEYEAWMIDVNE